MEDALNKRNRMMTVDLPRVIGKVLLLTSIIVILGYFAYISYIKMQAQQALEFLSTVPESSVNEVEQRLNSLDLTVVKLPLYHYSLTEFSTAIHTNIELQYIVERIELIVAGEQQYIPFLDQIRYKAHEQFRVLLDHVTISNILLALTLFPLTLFFVGVALSFVLFGLSTIQFVPDALSVILANASVNAQAIIAIITIVLGSSFIAY